MKKSLLLLCISIIVFSCKTEATQENVIEYASTITQDELKEHLYTYASDEFEGRDTGKPGQKKAVEYLKKEYEALGIPSVIEGNYFQNVPLNIVKTPTVSITINGESFNYFDDYISQTVAANGSVSATEVVYIGYGIDDEKYNDYKDLDVKGKIVVAKGGEPKDKAGNNILSGGKESSKWSNGRQALSSKRTAAKDNGAKALFLMDDKLFNRYAAFFKQRAERGGSNRLSLPTKEDGNPEIYDFLISEKMGKALVSNINESTEIATVATKFEMNYEGVSESMDSENVAAIIKGSEKPEEYIVISSHLDHVGVNAEGEVFNGADDDGSGTVAILEIADAFKAAEKDGHGPKRSVLFLHVTGEQKGLLGSKHLAKKLQDKGLNLYAMLNFEMVGVPLKDKDYLMYLTGYNLSNLADISNGYSKQKVAGFLPKAKEFNLFNRSDNAPFHEIYNVPSHTYSTFDFTNFNHYHQVGDEADKMDFNHMAKVVNTLIPVMESIINSPEQEIKYN